VIGDVGMESKALSSKFASSSKYKLHWTINFVQSHSILPQPKPKMKIISLLLASLATCSAFSMAPSKSMSTKTSTSLYSEVDSRRTFVTSSSVAALSLLGVLAFNPEEALASGGATAGKYT
jgi:hypothetical protein